MKTCYKCQQFLPLNQFSKNLTKADGLSNHCRACHKIMRREHYLKNRRKSIQRVRDREQEIRGWIRNYKETHPCTDCGKYLPYYQMDFDHLHDKKFDIGSHGHQYGFQALEEEIAKCELVCALCHRERTYQRKTQAGLAH